MKLGNETAGIRKEPIVFRRGEKKFVFWVTAQASFEPFREMCPPPEPPTYKQPGKGSLIRDINDPEYQKACKEYASNFTNWLVVASLSETPDLEWEKVKLSGKFCFKTWKFWQDELREFGLCEREITQLVNKVNQVNALSDAEMEENIESFLSELDQSEQQKQDTSHNGEVQSTSSGESVSS